MVACKRVPSIVWNCRCGGDAIIQYDEERIDVIKIQCEYCGINVNDEYDGDVIDVVAAWNGVMEPKLEGW